MFQPLIEIYRSSIFVYYHWGCTSVCCLWSLHNPGPGQVLSDFNYVTLMYHSKFEQSCKPSFPLPFIYIYLSQCRFYKTKSVELDPNLRYFIFQNTKPCNKSSRIFIARLIKIYFKSKQLPNYPPNKL